MATEICASALSRVVLSWAHGAVQIHEIEIQQFVLYAFDAAPNPYIIFTDSDCLIIESDCAPPAA
jgi:mevalonate pyrophosphate decarboxylase